MPPPEIIYSAKAMYPRYQSQFSLSEQEVTALLRTHADGYFFSVLDHGMSVFILRHGQSEGNARNTYQGRLDFPLSPQGEKQAKAAGEWLSQFKPEIMLASPMQRARRSAEIAAEAAGISAIEYADMLIELDTGVFSGLDSDTVARKYPEIWNEFLARSWDAVPGAESSSMLYARALCVWQKILELGRQGTSRIVCMTHGGLVQWLLKSTMGVHSWMPLFPMSNCGISEYEIKIVKKSDPAFVQWAAINFHPPAAPEGLKPVF